ncbi:MAG: AAA family ATPase, partial [Parabacteroides sp.]|nr:AAA family ATPase [Parabacteroides sp.]
MNGQKQREKPKRIPYGMMNFGRLRRDNCYFVDKTRFIEQIEEANKYFFFIRPRRFGKSLTLSMLSHYYDINMKDSFDELFGDLYIGSHPTPERNQYLILEMNFASIHADLENYKEAMDRYCYRVFRAFCDRYQNILPPYFAERVLRESEAVDLLDSVCTECQTLGLPLYLLIDEYDHFTNKILAEPDCFDKYRKETHGEGYIRKFYDVIKDGTNKSIERLFMTG